MVKTAMEEVAKSGEFVRTEAQFRHWVRKDGSTPYQPEKGRYHLIVSLACPWASRCLFVRKFKGLDDALGVTVVDPVFVKTSEDPKDEHHGWAFEKPYQGAKTVREFYENHSKATSKFTVPILYDLERKEIVSNESSEIIRMLNSEFTDMFTKNRDVDLYGNSSRAEIDEVNSWVYPLINNGVYRSGFARSQSAYDKAVKDVFDGLDKVEDILTKQRYIASSDRITEADVRLFVTLVRFDEVYHQHFKCNHKMIRDYPNMINYVREIYQMDGIAETVDMYHIKNHYMRSHPLINPFGIVARGPDAEDDFKLPHDREERFPIA